MTVKSNVIRKPDGTFYATLGCHEPLNGRVSINLVSMEYNNRDAPVQNLCVDLMKLSKQLETLSLNLEAQFEQRTMAIEVEIGA